VDEKRKEAMLIAASIMAARTLAQYEWKKVPATVYAVGEAVRWAEQIMLEIDQRWPKR